MSSIIVISDCYNNRNNVNIIILIIANDLSKHVLLGEVEFVLSNLMRSTYQSMQLPITNGRQTLALIIIIEFCLW